MDQGQQLSKLFNNLNSGLSTILVGPQNSGKTTLLKQIINPKTAQDQLSDPPRLPLHYIDCRDLGNKISSDDFWETILKQLVKKPGLDPLIYRYTTKFIEENNYNAFEIETYFLELNDAGFSLGLLVDSLDQVFLWPEITVQKVLSSLRQLSTFTGGLRLVMATRLRARELNSRTAFLNPNGSPYFNTYVEIIMNNQ